MKKILTTAILGDLSMTAVVAHPNGGVKEPVVGLYSQRLADACAARPKEAVGKLTEFFGKNL